MPVPAPAAVAAGDRGKTAMDSCSPAAAAAVISIAGAGVQ